MAGSAAKVSVWRAAARTSAVVLVLHGGAEHGSRPVRPWRQAYLRMVPLARAIHSAGASRGVEVRVLRNRVRGWNDSDLDAVVDARGALDDIRAEHPGLPTILVGHSMGGRVALHVAADPSVRGVCALAPWTPKCEPTDPITDRAVLIAHGQRDARTKPAHSYAYARRAAAKATRLARFEIADEGHAMLRRMSVWTDLVRTFVLETAGVRPASGALAAAWDTPPQDRLRIRL